MKRLLAIVFGGKTCEHDISIISGLQLIENVNRDKYNVLPIYIDRQGGWYTGDILLKPDFYKNFDPAKVKKITVDINNGDLICPGKKGLFSKETITYKPDCVIPAMHGLNGEDGSLAGLFQLAGIPFASSGVLGGSVGMDKILMKAAFIGAGLDTAKYVYFERSEFDSGKQDVIERTEASLSYPMFVKPANLGSSIGISRADDRAGLEKAIEIACQYDRRILVEEAVQNRVEINCSALGYGKDVETSLCEQPVSWEKFLSFEDKYLNGGKIGSAKGNGGMANLSRIIPAPVSDEITQKVKSMTEKAFKLLDCCGVVRIDYLLDSEKNKLYINEINTMPGSFAYYLWQPMGVEYPALIDKLVECAMRAKADSDASIYSYNSKALDNYSSKGSSKAGGKL